MNIQSQARIAEDERLRREAEIRLQQERQQEEQRRQQEEMRRRNEEIRRSQAGQAQQVGLGGGGMGGAPNPAMISKFTGGGGAGAGGGAGGAAGGGSGAAGGLGAAVPWAALAAAIVGNEYFANKDGRRPESKTKWGTELLTGKVLERDMDYYGDKVGGIGGQALKGIGQLGNPEGTLKFIKKLF